MSRANGLEKGRTLHRQGRLKEACQIYAGILQDDPDNSEALQLMGQAAFSVNDMENAEKFFRASLQMNSNQFVVWLRLGDLYQKTRQPKAALECFEGATRATPENAEGWRNLGFAHLVNGDQEKAEDCLRKACRLNPPSSPAFRLLANSFPITEDDEVVKRAQELLATNELDDFTKGQLNYALAYAFERAGKDKKFIQHLHAANRFQGKNWGDWKSNFFNNFNIIKKIFNSTLLAQAIPKGAPIPVPIFIVGLPRSGSTLVEQILSSHPETGAGDETGIIPNKVIGALSEMTGKPFLAGLEDAKPEQLENLSKLYLETISTFVPGKDFITDKFLGNFWTIGLIRMILPQAKVIHVQRNPIDNAFSIYRNCFLDYIPYSTDLGELGEYYALYRDVMDFWHKLLPGFIHDLKYESLIENQEKETRKLLLYCGLSFESACLAPEDNPRPVMTLSNTQVRQPVNRAGIGKWHRFENELSPFTKMLQKKGRLPT